MEATIRRLSVAPKWKRWVIITGMSLTILIGCESPTRPLVIGTQTPTANGQLAPTNPSNPNIQPTVPVASTTESQAPTIQSTAPIVSETTDTVPTVPVLQPSPAVPTIEVVQPPTGSDAWAAVQVNRLLFEAPQTYLLPSTQMLWWYDPVTAQIVPLGWISGTVDAIGQFQLRWQGTDALLLPYMINNSFGLTLDPSTIERIRRAGYTEDSIETFIYLAPDIVPQS